MFTTLRNAWKIPELRKKILFTLFVLLIYRLGACVPVPYVNVAELATYFSQQLSGTVLGLYNAMSGSAFSQATVFAIGIQPYINASIIIELLAIAIPALERLAKEGGEEGQKKIKIDKETWRGDPFYELKILRIYSDWAKTPFEKGVRKSMDEIEATGMRYRMTERANNMAVGSWQGASGGMGFSGDFMAPFTKEFWNVKGRKRRARTLEVLRAYGDSITVRGKEPVKTIKN